MLKIILSEGNVANYTKVHYIETNTNKRKVFLQHKVIDRRIHNKDKVIYQQHKSSPKSDIRFSSTKFERYES